MTKNKIKTIIMVVAIILCLALAGGWIAQTVINNKEKANDNEVFTITPQKSSSKLKLSAQVYSDDEGISTYADTSSYTIIAQTTHYSGEVNWSMAWLGEEVYWKSNEKTSTVGDCVKLTAIDERSARVQCLQPFGRQIEITASLAQKPGVTAKCVCDFRQTYVLDELTIGFNTFHGNGSLGRGLINELGIAPAYIALNVNQSLNYGCSFTYSSYTKPVPEITSMPELSFSLVPNMEVAEAFGLEGYSFKTYTVNFDSSLSGNIEGFFDKTWAEYAVANTDSSTAEFGADLCAAENTIGFGIDSAYLYTLTISGLPEGDGSVSYGYRIDISDLIQLVDNLATLDLNKSNITFGGN